MRCTQLLLLRKGARKRDMVDDGRTGLLVRLGDVKGLASALERLICDPGLRASMGAAGREKIRDYSLDRVLGEMSDIYSRYLGIK